MPRDAAPTIEEFLEELAFSDRKLVYLDGRIVAFAGGSIAHVRLRARLIAAFSAAAKPGCYIVTSDAAVRVGRDAHVFPDLAYTCEAVTSQATEITAPSVVVEVISSFSTRRDRVEKLRAYQRLVTLEAYVLVDSQRPSITIFTRDGDGSVSVDSIGPDAIAYLEALDSTLPLRELYDA